MPAGRCQPYGGTRRLPRVDGAARLDPLIPFLKTVRSGSVRQTFLNGPAKFLAGQTGISVAAPLYGLNFFSFRNMAMIIASAAGSYLDPFRIRNRFIAAEALLLQFIDVLRRHETMSLRGSAAPLPLDPASTSTAPYTPHISASISRACAGSYQSS